MERPKIKNLPKKRDVTGEIVHLDTMRRNGVGYPGKFSDLSGMAIDMRNCEAGMYESAGTRPEIMDLYDEYDSCLSDTEASCIALANELLALKDEKNILTFVDICVDEPASEVLTKLKSTKAGELLTADDEQLAMESDGEHYPILDMRKEQADLVGVGLRVWGWDHRKYTYTDNDGKKSDPQKDLLFYPEDEKMAERKLEIDFLYRNRQSSSDGSDDFTETVSLMIDEYGDSYLSRSVSSMAYTEMGYEGHHHAILDDIEGADIAAFGDLVAEIVGDEPESTGMRQSRHLAEMIDGISSDQTRGVVQELLDKTWPAQANSILSLRLKESGKTLAQTLQSDDNVERAIEVLRWYIDGE
ncbi:MAG TPA: hypothetical protein VFM68_02665 [Candidatus Saccharimonadales bacterium]|nr:hypothetical protein [Candidatus Saccharimonadales bacterium]